MNERRLNCGTNFLIRAYDNLNFHSVAGKGITFLSWKQLQQISYSVMIVPFLIEGYSLIILLKSVLLIKEHPAAAQSDVKNFFGNLHYECSDVV